MVLLKCVENPGFDVGPTSKVTIMNGKLGFLIEEGGGEKRTLWAYIALGLGVMALTVSPLFVRWADAPGIITSFYRYTLATLFLAPFFIHHLRNHGKLTPAQIRFPIVAGVFTALDHGFWSTAIDRTTVANATLLNYISPLWVALFAWIVWREHLGFRFWISLVAILAGASAVLGSTILIRPHFVQGDFLAIISSFFYAGFFLATQKGRNHLGTVPFLWITMLVGSLCLLSGARTLGMPILGYSRATYVTFLLAALISQLCGYFLITYALGTLPASVVMPTMVAQPVLTAIIAIPIVGEPLLTGQILGGLVALLGIYIINASKKGVKDTAIQAVDVPGIPPA
jgi:drug/metabolite transporter (DMT)-like permease